MVDNFKDSHVAYNFLELGLGDPVPFSALHGLNIDELLDLISARLAGTEAGSKISETGRKKKRSPKKVTC